jgi:hypothetical protein
MAKTSEPFSLEERIGALISEYLEWTARAQDRWAQAERFRRTGRHGEGRRLRSEAQSDLTMLVLVNRDLLAAGPAAEEVLRLAPRAT